MLKLPPITGGFYRIDFAPVTVNPRTGATINHIVTAEPEIVDECLVISKSPRIRVLLSTIRMITELEGEPNAVTSLKKVTLVADPKPEWEENPRTPPGLLEKALHKRNKAKSDGKR